LAGFVKCISDDDDNFDWTSYLLEGEEIFAKHYEDSPVSDCYLCEEVSVK